MPVPRIDSSNMDLGIVRRTLGHSYLIFLATRRIGLEAWWVANKYRYRQVHKDDMGPKISCALMQRLVEIKEKYGTRVIVVLQYNGYASLQEKPPWFGSPVVQCAREQGLEVVDTFPTLHQIATSDPEKFKALWFDEGGQLGHMTPIGNKIIADLISEKFRSSGR